VPQGLAQREGEERSNLCGQPGKNGQGENGQGENGQAGGGSGKASRRKLMGLSGARGLLPRSAAATMLQWLLSHWDTP